MRKKLRTISTTLYFITSAPITADNRMPLPVADSRFSVYTAPSLVGLVTTGATFSTRLCRPSIGKLGAYRLFRKLFTGGRPQMKTNTVRIAQGVQARTRAAVECTVSGWAGLASPPSASWPLRVGERQIWRGCQTRRNRISETMETMAAMMSTSSGPM